MAFCSDCGAALDAGVKFCAQCGATVQNAEPVCTGCGKKLVEGEKFCAGCGTPIGAAAEAAVARNSHPTSFRAETLNYKPLCI